MAKTPQAYLVQAIRRIWRYSPERRECLKNAVKCYTCDNKFKKQPKYKVRKSDSVDGAYDLVFSDKADDWIMCRDKKDANSQRKTFYKLWRKEHAAQADHVVGVGKAPTDWCGWDVYLKRMFGNKLAPICVACHLKKNAIERKKRSDEKKAYKDSLVITGKDLDEWASRLPGKDK